MRTYKPNLPRRFFQKPANVAAFKDPRKLATILKEHSLSAATIKTALPFLRANFTQHLAADPAKAEQYFWGILIGGQRSFLGLRNLMAKLALPIVVETGKINPEVQSKYVSLFLGLPVLNKDMAEFKPEYVDYYSERFSWVRGEMARSQAGTIPKLIKEGHAKADAALDIHLRMLWDEYTEVCEAAMHGMITILAALVRADHPRAKPTVELIKNFLKDRNDYIQGYACRALGRAAIAYIDKDQGQFQEIVNILIKRARANPKSSRRAAALHALAYIYRKLNERKENLPLQLQIIDAFRKNCRKLEHLGSEEILYNQDKEVFKFIRLLCASGEYDTALEFTRIALKQELSIVSIYGLLSSIYRVEGEDSRISDLLVEYMVEQSPSGFDEPSFRCYADAVLLVKDKKPELARQLLTNIAFNLRFYEENGEGIKEHSYGIWYDSKTYQGKVRALISAAEELGLPQVLVNSLVSDLDHKQIDNRRIGQLRKLVDQLRPVAKKIYLYYELMLHSVPRPSNLTMARVYLRTLKNDEAAARPILIKIEQILSSVYELDIKKTRRQLLSLSRTIEDKNFDRARKSFVYWLGRDKIRAAKLLGGLMQQVSRMPETVLPTIDRVRLLFQFHYLGYGLFNNAYQEVAENDIVTSLEIQRSQVLAVQAMGYEPAHFTCALARIEQIVPRLAGRVLDQRDLFELDRLAGDLVMGLAEIGDMVSEVLSKGIREVAQGMGRGEQKWVPFITDNIVRASLLQQLSEFSFRFSYYIDSINRVPGIEQKLRREAVDSYDAGRGVFTTKSPTKLAGQVIALARGNTALEYGALKVWFERAEQGLLELYSCRLIGFPFGVGYLNDQQLSVAELKTILGVSASDNQLMSMWRDSD